MASDAPTLVDATRSLFEPVSVGPLLLRNRLMMAPMGTSLDHDGYITDATIAYYRRRAQGGVGSIAVEGCLVSPYSEGPEPHISGEKFLPGLTRLVDAIKAYDVTVGVQLMQPGRQVLAGIAKAPSPVPLNSHAPVPHELTRPEIREIVGDYANATRLARRAGFDFVEVHGAHGYLPSNFLSPRDNQRTDEYGGSLENRARFALEVAEAILEAGEDACPLVWRLNADDAVPGGFTIDEAVIVSRWLEAQGVHAISVSAGTWHTLHVTLAPMSVPRGHLLHYSRAIKEAVDIPVIAVGRLDDPELAGEAVTTGAADVVLLGRTLIAEPDWPRKVQEQRFDEVRPCIACNACVDLVGKGEPARCSVNPEVGRELVWSVTPAERARKVMVIGSGPAGMEAARIARLRGHEVSIWERDDQLGGKLEVAGLAPSKREVLRFRDYQSRILGELGVEIRLGMSVTPEHVREAGPDVVLVATGAEPLIPPIPGIGSAHVFDAQAFLKQEVPFEPGERVAIVGGSATGCEAAEMLADLGAQVAIIEMRGAIGHGIESITRREMIRALRKHGVEVLTRATVVMIDPDQVLYETPAGERLAIGADKVALALGWRPRGLTEIGELDGIEVVVLGDATEPGDFVAAINAGADAGLRV